MSSLGAILAARRIPAAKGSRQKKNKATEDAIVSAKEAQDDIVDDDEEEEEEPAAPVAPRKKKKATPAKADASAPKRARPAQGNVNDEFRAEYGVLPVVKMGKMRDAVVQARFTRMQTGVFEYVNAVMLQQVREIIAHGIVTAQNDRGRSVLTLEDAKTAFKQIGRYPTVFIG